VRPPVVPKVRALECPNCGGTVEIRGHAHSINAVCVQCLSILDTRTPSLEILQRFERAQRFMPLIPLGKRGALYGVAYEAIGFQVRQITVDGIAYQWSEYLLYNPYKGYLYLSEYEGHWNIIRTIRALPEPGTSAGKKTMVYGPQTYKHFQSAEASTVYVMGEFPWQVRVGETAVVNDYVSPPYMLSSESTGNETTWSAGTYTDGSVIWKAFELNGEAAKPRGIFSNQPSPHKGKISSLWTIFFLMLMALLFLVAGVSLLSPNKEVFRQTYSYASNMAGEPSFVTPMFEVPGSVSTNVEVEILTNLENDWAFFGMALINDGTGVAYDFGEEISYYSGRDSDGSSWTEGRRTGSETISPVPAGRYYLRIEPEMEKTGLAAHSVNYEVIVHRGVPGWGWFVLAFLLLPLPALIATWRAFSFENARWAESDYGSMFSSSGSSEDDE
jgi:hypothetical protein